MSDADKVEDKVEEKPKPKRCTHGHMTCHLCDWAAGRHKPLVIESKYQG